ncbi:MAG: DNA primase [Rubrivivax sp.]
MIPAGFLQDLLSRVDVVDVVGAQVELKKAGINHKGLCPFHGEKTPSFIVSPARQTYHCFGCGAHGDAIRFLTEQAGLSFPDAVRELAQQVGMTVPDDERDPAERERAARLKEHQATLGEVLEQAAVHYRGQLKASPRAIQYLKGRGLTGAVAARFGLGYAPAGWRSLASGFARYDDPRLVEAGLVITQDAEPDASGHADPAQAKRYDRFRDRVMFPIRSVRGEVIGFGGRVLDQGEPKYLNSPETPVFSKGRELYGLFEARQALRERGHVLVVEGYMDVVALAQAGLGNAVATLGTACTADHVAKLFRHTESVVFSFDGDAAGRRAAGRALEAALPHATDLRSVRFLFLPPEHDPDSFVRAHGVAAFEALVAAAVPLSRQLIEHAGEGLDLASAEGRARMLALARPLWELLPAGVLRSQLLAGLADAAAMAPAGLEAAWANPRPGRGAARGTDTDPRRAEGGAAPARSSTFARAANRRLAPAATSLLDRAAWLLARHADLWHELPATDHELLATQPDPHGRFFCRLEQLLHDDATTTATARLEALASCADADVLTPLLTRIGALHHFDEEEAPASQLAAAMWRLRQQAVDDELQLLIESGELADAAAERRGALLALRATLKQAPPAEPGVPGRPNPPDVAAPHGAKAAAADPKRGPGSSRATSL